MNEKSCFCPPTTWIFRLLARRTYAKFKSIQRYKKSLVSIGIVASAIFLLASRFHSPTSLRPARAFSQDATRANPAFQFVVASKMTSLSSAGSEGGLEHAHFGYVIGGEAFCSSSRHLEKGQFLLILVSSAPGHSDRRFAIRRTWADLSSIANTGVVVRFLLGLPPEAPQQALLEKENEAFGDIVQGSFVDSYTNLSIKSVMGLNWANRFCHGIDYVMKTDDDVFVNVRLLADFLRVHGERRWIGGCIKQKMAPAPFDLRGVRVPMVIGHPPFVAGAGYVISGDIVHELYDASTRRAIVPVEDAFVTAYCARMIGVAPSHYDAFNCGEPVFDDCQMKTKFVGHHVTPDRQRQIWERVNDSSGQVCKMLRD